MISGYLSLFRWISTKRCILTTFWHTLEKITRSHPWLLKIIVYKSYFKMWCQWFAWMFRKRKQKWGTYHFGDISFQAPPLEAAAPPIIHLSSTTVGGGNPNQIMHGAAPPLRSHKTSLYPHMHTIPSHAWYYALTSIKLFSHMQQLLGDIWGGGKRNHSVQIGGGES